MVVKEAKNTHHGSPIPCATDAILVPYEPALRLREASLPPSWPSAPSAHLLGLGGGAIPASTVLTVGRTGGLYGGDGVPSILLSTAVASGLEAHVASGVRTPRG